MAPEQLLIRPRVVVPLVWTIALFFSVACSAPRLTPASLDANPLGLVGERPNVDLDAVEARILDLVNVERSRRRLPPLLREARLDGLARAHSADMAERRFFDHTNPDGASPTQRGEAAGISCVRPAGEDRVAVGIGENIFSTYLFSSFQELSGPDGVTRRYAWKNVDALAQEAVDRWMGSRGHRLNLISRQYQTIGIGAARDAEHQLYLTQSFC
jgi:uncharacterized protein YkwD